MIDSGGGGAIRWQLERETANPAAGSRAELWHAAGPGGVREGISATFAGILDYALTQQLEQKLSKRPAALLRPQVLLPKLVPAKPSTETAPAGAAITATTKPCSAPVQQETAETPARAAPARQLSLPGSSSSLQTKLL